MSFGDKMRKLMGRERRYGDDGTVHHTGHVDVEIAPNGQVVSVWFRCAMIPFKQTNVDASRADSMRQAYESPPSPLTAVVFKE